MNTKMLCSTEPQTRPAPSPRRGEGWGEGVTIERLVPHTPALSPMGRGSPAVPRLETVLHTQVRIGV
jgi:hypothetical protein